MAGGVRWPALTPRSVSDPNGSADVSRPVPTRTRRVGPAAATGIGAPATCTTSQRLGVQLRGSRPLVSVTHLPMSSTPVTTAMRLFSKRVSRYSTVRTAGPGASCASARVAGGSTAR